MRRPAALIERVESAVALTEDVAKALPSDSGVYAAWIVEASGLRDAGIAGPPPVLVYVGVAKNLRQRLGNRRGSLDFRLHELLATRGTLLWPWGGRVPRLDTDPRRWCPSELDWIALSQAAEWQRQNVSWAWERCATPEKAKAFEDDQIIAGQPLLNVRGVITREPPQLRQRQGYPRARARWLWQTSWAGALATTRARYSSDELGYPVRDRYGDRPPRPRDLGAWMRRAARGADPEVRRAIGAGLPPRHARMWWAAHLGDHDLLQLGLACAPERAFPAPATVPAGADVMDDLMVLGKRLRLPRYTA
jgi:hypothetical protein